MTPLGVFVVVATVAVLTRRRGFPQLLAVVAGFPIGVIATVGGQPAPTFFTLGAGVCAWLAFTWIASRRSEQPSENGKRPGAIALVLFVGWSILVTVMAPTIFAGIPVLVARGGIDEQFLDPGNLTYTVSNIAQVAYLVISIGVVFFLARSPGTSPGLLGITLVVITALSFWRLLSLNTGLPFPEGFFDNSTTSRIIETTPDGEPRFRGIFSEPSGLAAASLTAMVFFALRIPYLSRWQRVGALAVIIMAAINAANSTAGTFVAAGLILVAIVVLVWMGRFLLNKTRVSPLLAAAAILVAGSALFFVPLLIEFVQSVISVKVSSSSFGSRTGVDQFSYLLTLNTWGFGVGLGSNRPSSFFASLLSCTGVLGAALFILGLGKLMIAAAAKPEYHATIWALVSVLVCKVVSSPNISDNSALLWISCGVLAHAAWQTGHDDGNGHATSSTPTRDRMIPSVSGTSPNRF